MKKLQFIIATVVCLGVFIYAAFGIGNMAIDYYKNRKVIDTVQEKFYTTVSAKENEDISEPNEPEAGRPEFQELLKQNDELVGWIKIEDTKIDYPILQADNNEDYLTRNFNKEYSILGSIFMDYRNDINELSKNTIIYGHRTKDGSMFQHLTKYMDSDFFENHQTFDFETLHDSYEAEIFAVYITMTDFNYIQTDFANDAEYEQFLTRVQEESMYETDVEVGKDDLILTLSTCDYELDANDGRLVVQAKLVKMK